MQRRVQQTSYWGGLPAFALELKKGGVVFLDCPDEPAPGEALLRWSASPKILRSLDASS